MPNPVRRHPLRGQQQGQGLLLLAKVRVCTGPVSQMPAAGCKRQSRVRWHPGGRNESGWIVLGDHADIRRLHGDEGGTERDRNPGGRSPLVALSRGPTQESLRQWRCVDLERRRWPLGLAATRTLTGPARARRHGARCFPRSAAPPVRLCGTDRLRAIANSPRLSELRPAARHHPLRRGSEHAERP
jgi:hypothetical protein